MSVTSYTRKTLTAREKIIHTGDIHRFCYIYPLILVAIGFLLLINPPIPEDLAENSEHIGMIRYYFLKTLYEVETFFHEFKSRLPKEIQPMISMLGDVRRYLIGFLLVGVGSGVYVHAYIRRISEEHVVTTRKVILKQGWIAVDEKEITLDRIESVKVHQSMLDRLLNRGDILITGIGMEQIVMKHLAEPVKFRQAVLNAVERYSQHSQYI